MSHSGAAASSVTIQPKASLKLAKQLTGQLLAQAKTPALFRQNFDTTVRLIESYRRNNIWHEGILMRAIYCYFINKYKNLLNTKTFNDFLTKHAKNDAELIARFTRARQKLSLLLINIDPGEGACPSLQHYQQKAAFKPSAHPKVEDKNCIEYLHTLFVEPYVHFLILRDDGVAMVLWTYLLVFTKLSITELLKTSPNLAINISMLSAEYLCEILTSPVVPGLNTFSTATPADSLAIQSFYSATSTLVQYVFTHEKSEEFYRLQFETVRKTGQYVQWLEQSVKSISNPSEWHTLLTFIHKKSTEYFSLPMRKDKITQTQSVASQATLIPFELSEFLMTSSIDKIFAKLIEDRDATIRISVAMTSRDVHKSLQDISVLSRDPLAMAEFSFFFTWNITLLNSYEEHALREPLEIEHFNELKDLFDLIIGMEIMPPSQQLPTPAMAVAETSARTKRLELLRGRLGIAALMYLPPAADYAGPAAARPPSPSGLALLFAEMGGADPYVASSTMDC